MIIVQLSFLAQRSKSQRRERTRHDSPFTKGVNFWNSTEPEKEEKLDPNNQFLEDLWKSHGKA